jgi:hypothetical protein
MANNSRPIVFISHSARHDDVPYSYLRIIEATLKAQGFDVLVDETRLQPGQSWRSSLDLWMAHCHAAIILVSQKALDKSEWVLKEATILRWRDSLDEITGRKSGFQLLPVFIDVSSAQVDQAPGFGPLKLTEIQALRGLKPKPLAKKIASTLAPLLKSAGDSPRRRLETKIANQLANATSDTLRAVANALKTDLGGFKPHADPALEVAMLLLHAPLAQLRDALGELAGAVTKETVSAIFSMLSHSWVDSQAASLFGSIVRDAPERRAVLLNALEPRFSGKAYVSRASDKFPTWPYEYVVDTNGGDTFAALKRQILDALRSKYGGMRDEFLQNYIETAGSKEAFIIIVHPPDEHQPLIPEADIVSVLGFFKGATLLICSGASPLAAEVLPNVRRLEPQLTPGQESESFGLYLDCAVHAGVQLGE